MDAETRQTMSGCTGCFLVAVSELVVVLLIASIGWDHTVLILVVGAPVAALVGTVGLWAMWWRDRKAS